MRSLIVACAALFAVAGCSSPDEGSQPSPPASSTPAAGQETSAPAPGQTPEGPDLPQAPETPEDAVEEAVTTYSDAFLTGNVKVAFSGLSQRCRERVGSDQFGDIVEQAGNTYGSALPIKTFEADVKDSEAVVTYTYDLAAIDQDAEPWVLEDGSWHNDQC